MALTPGLFERRLRVSSSASGPLVCEGTHSLFSYDAMAGEEEGSRSLTGVASAIFDGLRVERTRDRYGRRCF